MTAVAIANGKGGVGKSSIAANLAVSLAEHGHRTLLVDADLGLASLDLILGLKPQTTLRHVLRDGADIAATVLPGPEGIDVITGGAGSKELVGLTKEEIEGLLQKIQGVGSKYAFVVYDTASGLDENVMAFLRASKRVLIVATPEPTSIMDAYATAKVLFGDAPKADVSLVVNMAEDERQGAIVFERFKTIVGQFLNHEVSHAGVLTWDESVMVATRVHEPFILKFPKCKPSKQIDALAEWLIGQEATEKETKEQPEDERVTMLQKMRKVFAVFQKEKKEEPVAEQPKEEEAEERRAA